MSVVYFLLLVGVLVAIHEFGHFLAAKLLDFKVLKFSIGFGRPLVKIKVGETEYQIAIIPLGGYVRILGEDVRDDIPPDDLRRSFNAKPIWRRLVVVFAGPAANLILPIFIFFAIEAGQDSKPAAVVGDVLVDSPAVNAGLEPGDRVMSVNGTSIRYWEELDDIVRTSAGDELRLRFRRGDKELEKYVRPVEYTERARDGMSSKRGYIGIRHAPFPPIIGVIDRESPAYKADLRSGDRIVSIGRKPIHNWTALRRELSHGLQARDVVRLRGTPVPGVPHVRLLASKMVTLVPDGRRDEDGKTHPYTGIEPANMFVSYIAPGSPANKAGIEEGDLIVSLDDEPVHHWVLFDQRLQSDPSRSWKIGLRRWDPEKERVVEQTKFVTQTWQKHRDEYGHVVERLVFGASNNTDPGQGEMIPISNRFTYAASTSFSRTGETISVMVGGFWSILAGKASSETVGGPLMMYRVASVSGKKGWETFLLMMALISINLGLINLLPIPVLDGGHVMLFVVEAVTRKPLSIKMRERINLVGLAIVGIITILALRNDVIRYVL